MTSENENSSDTKEVFIGPSQANWYKFQIARVGMMASNKIPYFTKNYIGNRIFNWSFKTTMMSRDFEVINESSEDE